MKTIQLSISDATFRKLRTEVFASALGQSYGVPHHLWKLVIDAIERGDTEKTILTKKEADEEGAIPEH